MVNCLISFCTTDYDVVIMDVVSLYFVNHRYTVAVGSQRLLLVLMGIYIYIHAYTSTHIYLMRLNENLQIIQI